MATAPDSRPDAARFLGEAWADLLAEIDRHGSATAPNPDGVRDWEELLTRDAEPRRRSSLMNAIKGLRHGIGALFEKGADQPILEDLERAFDSDAGSTGRPRNRHPTRSTCSGSSFGLSAR